MAPFDKSYTTFYWSAIVSTALCCTISSYLTLNNRDLEIWVRGQSRSLKLIPFESFCVVSCSPYIVTVAVSSTRPMYGIFSVKVSHDLKTGLGVVQDH